MVKFTEAEKRKLFSRNKKVVNRVVRNFLAKNKVGIVHGTRATNAQLPSFLRKETTDWDVFVSNPKMKAMMLERALDRKFGGDFFRIKKGVGSPGIRVWKIKDNINDESFVDFATSDRKVPSIPKRGVQFATLKDQQKKAQENIRDPEAKFRREKDRSLLNRIKRFEKLRGREI